MPRTPRSIPGHLPLSWQRGRAHARRPRSSNSCPCGSIDGLRHSREPPAPRSRTTTSQTPFPYPGKVGARVRADRAAAIHVPAQQQAPAQGPGNHLRPDHHVPGRGRGGTCSSAGVARGGATRSELSITKMMIFHSKPKLLLACPVPHDRYCGVLQGEPSNCSFC